MQTETFFNDFLAKYLDRYELFFASTSGLASLLFAATSFLLLRRSLLQDDDIGEISRPWLVLVGLMGSTISFVAVFFASAKISDFYDLAMKSFPRAPTCVEMSPGETIFADPYVEFFQQCIRGELAFWSQIVVASLLASVLVMLTWFVLHTRTRNALPK